MLFGQVFAICKINLCTLKQLYFNLLSKLQNKKNCLKVHNLILQITKTCSKSNFFVRQHIFDTVARFAPKQIWASENCHLAYSKLVGTPCRNTFKVFPMRETPVVYVFFHLAKKVMKKKGRNPCHLLWIKSSMSHKISSNLVNRFSHQEVFLLRTRKVEHFCCPVYGWMMQCGAWQTSVYEEDGELFCLQVILERCRTWYYSINIVFSGMKYQ